MYDYEDDIVNGRPGFLAGHPANEDGELDSDPDGEDFLNAAAGQVET